MSDTQNPGSVPSPNPRRASRAGRSRAGGRRTRRHRPAGIILLIVLVLLALFTMLLISFVVATSSNRLSVMQSARIEQTGDTPQSQLYDAFMQVVRGSRDANSIMGPHSLLEDIYGQNSGATGVLPGATPTITSIAKGVRGTILPGTSSFPNNIGYLMIQDNSVAGSPLTPVPFLPDGTTMGAQNITGGTGTTVNNSLYSHTPILAFQASIAANDPMWAWAGISARPPFGFYNGRLITMLTGPAAGRTGRIVGYYFNANNLNDYVQVLGFDGAVPDPGDQFLINGRPFSGTGFGYRPLSFVTYSSLTSPLSYNPTRLLDAVDASFVGYPWNGSATSPATQTGFQYALLPNPRRGVFTPLVSPSPAAPSGLTSYLDPAGPGGANEDYDAPDFQNMLLAMRIWAAVPVGSMNYEVLTPLPSLHRPDLISYWNNRWKNTISSNYLIPNAALSPAPSAPFDAVTSLSNPNYFNARNLLRKISLRPLSILDDGSTPAIDESENPNFTGSNPSFDMINGPWDVDNDGDGVPDSIWVDLGLPVQQSPDGRRYKPMFAILCVDMDGKLNVNAHSSFRHCPPPLSGPAPSRFANLAAPFLVPPGAISVGGTPPNYPLRVGSGYGPPEISLHPIFEPAYSSGTPSTALAPTGELKKLLSGDSSQWLDGRYGEIELTGTALSVPPSVGVTWIDDPFNWMRELNLPPLYSWGTWAQHQAPYLPIHPNTSMPHISLPFTGANSPINTTMWSGNQWLRGYSSNYGTPSDLDGDGMLALDLRGQPMYLDYPSITNSTLAGDAGWGEPDEAIDDPYEIDLSVNARNDGYSQNTGSPNFIPNGLNGTNYIVSIDAPFTAAEIERVLRWRDSDAVSRPNRLIRLAPLALPLDQQLLAAGVAIRSTSPYPAINQTPNLLTHASFDVPAPSMVFTSPDLADNLAGHHAGSTLSSSANFAPPPLVNSHITQLLAARIDVESQTNPPPSNYPPVFSGGTLGAPLVDISITRMLAPELIAGERMNLNRPLGNGYDDNNNGITDEPGEADYGWSAMVTGGLPNNPSFPSSNTNSILFDLTNTGITTLAASSGTISDTHSDTGAVADNNLNGFDSPNLLARQTMARYLYVLMMLLADRSPRQGSGLYVQGNYDGNAAIAASPLPQSDTAYYFAQWAINIVDFLDSDSVITPFEFDLEPFNDNDSSTSNGTWDVDGNLQTATEFTSNPASDDHQDFVLNGGTITAATGYRGLVWGCERPELLITETIATHDRRTQDTSVDPTSKKVGPTPLDQDYDQTRRPQGSLIVELFNPNPPFAAGAAIPGQKPSEMYATAFNDPVTGAVQFGVNLGQMAGNYPVWRMAVRPRMRVSLVAPVPPLTAPPNPQAFLQPMRNPVLPSTANGATNNEIDRVVYFAQPAAGSRFIPNEGTREFYVLNGYTPIIPPNHYAVVGSAARDPYDTVDHVTPVTHLGWRSKLGDLSSAAQTDPMSTAPTSIVNKYHARIQYGQPSPTIPTIFTVYDDINSQGWPQPTGSVMPTPYTSRSSQSADVKPCIGIPIATLYLNGTTPVPLSPATWTAAGALTSLRWSVTEPDGGYPLPAVGTVLGPNANQYDDNAYFTQAGIKNTPFDSSSSGYFNAVNVNDQQRLNDIISKGTANANADETITNYTTVHLQRLANPTLLWDARANPYITVDQMWVDLTAYNSEKGVPTSFTVTEFPSSMQITSPAANTFFFDTRRRAPAATAMTGALQVNANNVWYHNISNTTLVGSSNVLHDTTVGATRPATGLSPLNPIPTSTLGYLNNEYGYVGTVANNRYTGSGGTNRAPIPSGASLPVSADEYRGDPVYQFPWLNWNNRPFVSAKELMLVPLASPSSLSAEITTSLPPPPPTFGGTPPAPNWAGTFYPPYDTVLAPTTPLPQPPLPMGEFGHLPNMFHSPQYDPSIYTSAPNQVIARHQMSPNFYRLLEYVHVPSRFTGTETWLPPAKMLGSFSASSVDNPVGLPTHNLHPPYNRVSQFRDPGKVNINTILDPYVWQGVVDDAKASTPTSTPPWRGLWAAVCQSRFGANLASAPTGTVDANAYLRADLVTQMSGATSTQLPSIFGAPFRSYAGNTLVPIDAMRRDVTNTSYEREVDSTMLRTMPFGTSPNVNYPLLEYPGTGNSAYGWMETLNSAGMGSHIDDETRNPYFAYKAMRRLDNLLTTRSNVYAVWITVGYFEVSPAPSNDPQRSVKYPDGWVLGQELGSDTGDMQRHRAFYMYDRTIPVGFERGENHNVNKGILLERFIE